MHCDPACWGCTAAGACPQQAPAVAVPPPPYRWTPHPMSYKRLACGHRIDVIPITLGVLGIAKVWCARCGVWFNPPSSVTTTTTSDDQEAIPF